MRRPTAQRRVTGARRFEKVDRATERRLADPEAGMAEARMAVAGGVVRRVREVLARILNEVDCYAPADQDRFLAKFDQQVERARRERN